MIEISEQKNARFHEDSLMILAPHFLEALEHGHLANADAVKTGSSRSGTDERGKCDNVGLSAACPSNEATIRSVVEAVA